MLFIFKLLKIAIFSKIKIIFKVWNNYHLEYITLNTKMFSTVDTVNLRVPHTGSGVVMRRDSCIDVGAI